MSIFEDYHGSFRSQKSDDLIHISAKTRLTHRWKAKVLERSEVISLDPELQSDDVSYPPYPF